MKANPNLKGDALNDALDKMTWDLSVKALAPFPQVLDMMAKETAWTQRLGEAFLAQQADVMDAVQKLRQKAEAAGNLKSTEQMKVVTKGEAIEIEPANPEVVYVPRYDPVVVYGPWWYPAYPPLVYSPCCWPGVAVGLGVFGFWGAVAVGPVWGWGWGSWGWGGHNVNINVNRNININRNVNISRNSVRTTSLHQAAAAGQIGSGRAAAAARASAGRAGAGAGRAGVGAGAGRAGAAARGAGSRPSATSVQQGLKGGGARGGAGGAAARSGGRVRVQVVAAGATARGAGGSRAGGAGGAAARSGGSVQVVPVGQQRVVVALVGVVQVEQRAAAALPVAAAHVAAVLLVAAVPTWRWCSPWRRRQQQEKIMLSPEYRRLDFYLHSGS